MKRPCVYLISALLASTAFTAVPANAGEKEDRLIEKIVDAYGGARLENLRSLRITDTLKNIGFGQGWSSDYIELTQQKQDVQIDYAGQRATGEFWNGSATGSFHTGFLVVDEDVTGLNYRAGFYFPGPAPNFEAAIGVSVRTSDTLLARELGARADNAAHGGETVFLGRAHEVITFEYPGSTPLTLYVDAETGFISKMTRDNPVGTLTYQFAPQVTEKGLAYAPGFDFYVAENPISITLSREVAFNNVRDSAFRLDANLTQRPDFVDTSEMAVAEIADGVHLAGTGNGYTMFVDAGDHIIGAGGYPGLTDRLTAYQEAAGHEKPLEYQVVTHHHTDHLGGMGEANALGVTFVAPEGAIANLRTALGDPIADDRIMLVGEKKVVGPVEIYTIATSHVEEFALVYHPASQTVFQADHYNSNFAEGFAAGNRHTMTLKAAIDALGLDVKTVLSAHGPVPTPWEDFVNIAATVDLDPCPSNRAICQ